MNDKTPPDTVASLMIPLERYPHLSAEAPLREAVLLIYKGMAQPELSGFRRALVLGKDNVLVGIINMPILLQGLEPGVLRTEPGGPFQGYASHTGAGNGIAVQVFWEKVFTQGFGDEPGRAVGEVAQPLTATVTPEDKLARALHLMLTEKLQILPVVKNNQVLGVVRMIEIFGKLVPRIEKSDKP